ncbi:hypothetical protein NDU88_002900 [Pleurodeles waltl]|uniref:Uncharacterized protein n=1 Tax=Pleurodeles waltl TaxID=8319 RepID=A0AAV7RBN1_PLEWA|nr:hypothetical protein NDU88_002900 [Pleurodeles waltl]
MCFPERAVNVVQKCGGRRFENQSGSLTTAEKRDAQLSAESQERQVTVPGERGFHSLCIVVYGIEAGSWNSRLHHRLHRKRSPGFLTGTRMTITTSGIRVGGFPVPCRNTMVMRTRSPSLGTRISEE